MGKRRIVTPERVSFADIPHLLKRGGLVVVGVDMDDESVWTMLKDTRNGEHIVNSSPLSLDEQKRMHSFHRATDSKQYARQRLLLRAILSHCSGVDITDIAYRVNQYGKPSLYTDDNESNVRFTVTHSGSQFLIAVSNWREIGIDCEQYQRRPVSAATATFILPRRSAHLALRSHRAFVREWALREALVKCAGRSIYHTRAGMIIPRRVYRLALSSHFATTCVVRGIRGQSIYYYCLESRACELMTNTLLSGRPT